MAKEPTKTTYSKFLTFLSDIKILLAGLVLLPVFGANLISLVSWSSTVYNINDELKRFATKEESVSVVLDVLLYIEPAIRDDIISIQFSMDDMIQIQNRSREEDEILDGLRKHYAARILELNRIRERIREYKPDWKSVDDTGEVK